MILEDEKEHHGMEEWPTVLLGEIADISWGDTSTTKASYVESGFTAYSAKGPDGFLPYANYNRVGVVLSAIGADCGRTWLAKGQWSCIKNTIRFWAKDPKVDTEFLYWVTRNSSLWPKRGSAQPFISQGDARKLEISIPPLREQRAIAHILGTLDDKIELNRRMNETLEAMARALFKSWFVDFDPVRAKVEDRDTGLPSNIADLFPDRLVDSELGEIPEGWEVGTIRQLAERIQNGGTPKRSEPTYWEPGEIPWLTSGEIRQSLILKTQNFISKEGLANSSAKIVPGHSILVALYGATAGQVSMNYQPLSTNQAISAIIPSTGNRYFCLMSLKLEVSELENRAVGSAQQNISKKIVEDTMILLPCLKLRTTYDALVKPLFDRNFYILDENQTLSTLRDTLLPKLISGEIRLRDAETIVAEVS